MDNPYGKSTSPTIGFKPNGVGFVIILLGLALLIPRMILGQDALVRLHDTFDSEFPRFYETARQISVGNIVEWYPKLAGGIPTLAYHFTHLDPFVLLAKILPPWALYHFTVVGFLLISVYGLYWLARAFFGVRENVALGSALIFSAINYDYHVLSTFTFLFPILFCLLHVRRQTSLLGNIGVAILLLVLALTSYPILNFVSFSVFHFLLLLLLARTSATITKIDFVKFVLFWTALTIDFVPNVVALLEYLDFHHRTYSGGEFAGIFHFLTLYARLFSRSIFYGTFQFGLGPILVMGLILAVQIKRIRIVLFCIIFMHGIGVLVGSDFHYLVADTFIEKMDLSHFAWSQILLLFLLVITVLSGYEKSSKTLQISSLVASFFALALVPYLIFAAPADSKIGLAASFIIFPLVLIWLFPPKNQFRSFSPLLGLTQIVGLMALVVIGAARHSQMEREDYRSAMGEDEIMQALAKMSLSTPFRVLDLSIHNGKANFNGLETFGGRTPLANKYYKQLTEVVVNPARVDAKALQEYRDYWYDIRLDRLDKSENFSGLDLQRLALFNVCYVLTGAKLENLPKIDRSILPGPDSNFYGGYEVYRVPHCFDRAMLVPHQKAFDSTQETIDAMRTATIEQLGQSAWFDNQNAMQKMEGGAGNCGAITWALNQPDRMVLNIKSKRQCILIVNNNFHPRWQATINDNPAKIVRANVAFMGIYLPAEGEFEVRLEYKKSFGLWLYVFPLLSLILIFIAIMLPFKRRAELNSLPV